MKRLMAAVLLLPALGIAAEPADFAWQWPLVLERPDADAYRVELDPAVYRQARDAALRDIAVLDRRGRRVPMAIERAASTQRLPPARKLPWFALPAPDARRPGGGWSLSTEAGTDGRLRHVEVRSAGSDRAPAAAPGALLLDATGLDAPVARLDMRWRPAGALDMGIRVEGSDDLEHWRPLAAQGRLVDLEQDGRRLLRQRIVLPGAPRLRYLRLLPTAPGRLPDVLSVDATPRDNSDATPLHWLEPAPTAADAGFDYAVDGRFPIRQVDVVLPGVHAVQWRLSSRDDPARPWRPRLDGWLAFRGADGRRSPPQPLAATVRDRSWRLQAAGPVAGTPRLRLGYRPDVLVFVPQGEAPYTLVAGSVRPIPPGAGSPGVIAALRTAQGEAWRPASAMVGPGRVRAGDAALRPARDWRSLLLWAVLALGALLVATLATRLLRAPRPAGG